MELLTPGLGFFVWNLIAFLILLIILRKTAWKPILKSLKSRETGIAESLATAERVKAEMAQLKRAQLLKEARDTKDRIINEAKEQAKVEAGKIVADANAAIQQQKMAALTDVKNQVGTLVIEVAEKVLRRELTDKSQQEKYIKQLAEEVKLN